MNKHNNLQQDIYCYKNPPIYIVLYSEPNLESSVNNEMSYDNNQSAMKTFVVQTNVSYLGFLIL